MEKFSASVEQFKDKSIRRMLAVQQTATQELVKRVQTPVAKGGRMRVDTGFLRASGQGSLSGMPTGPTRGEPGVQYQGGGVQGVAAVLARWRKVGGTFFFGWTANYARIREFHDGFLRLELQNWQAIVDDAVRKVKARIKK